MFVYEKRLQYPIRIKQTNPKLAKIIVTQYGGAYFKCYDYYFLALQDNGLGMGFMSNYIVLDMLKNLKRLKRRRYN